MTGQLLLQPVLRAIDDNGEPMPGALMQFYATGTTNPQAVYTDETLETPLSNPVVADAGGLFPAIFLDPSKTYRAQLLTSASALVADRDPINGAQAIANGEVTAAMLAAGVAASNLGYTPVNKAGDTATNLALAFTAPAATSAGYLGAPVNEQDGNYAFVLGDCGKMVRCVSASAVTWTLGSQATVGWPLGAAIVVRNAGAGTITITRASGVILIGAGTNTNKDWTVTGYGVATLLHDASNDSWVISGIGVA